MTFECGDLYLDESKRPMDNRIKKIEIFTMNYQSRDKHRMHEQSIREYNAIASNNPQKNDR